MAGLAWNRNEASDQAWRIVGVVFLTDLLQGECVMSRILQVVLLGASVALFNIASVNAGVITGSLVSPDGASSSDPIDLSTGVTDWAYWGNHDLVGSTASPDVMSGGPSSFSDVTKTGSAGGTGTDSQIYISFSDGTPTASQTAGQKFIVGGDGVGTGVTFTHTLVGAQEDLDVYYCSWYSRSNITASLSSGGSFSLSDVAMPRTDGRGDGSQHGYGLLNLTVSGSPGDILTVSVLVSTAVDGNANANVGLQAASAFVTAVPEPGTLAMLVAGAFGLLAYAWRKRKQ